MECTKLNFWNLNMFLSSSQLRGKIPDFLDQFRHLAYLSFYQSGYIQMSQNIALKSLFLTNILILFQNTNRECPDNWNRFMGIRDLYHARWFLLRSYWVAFLHLVSNSFDGKDARKRRFVRHYDVLFLEHLYRIVLYYGAHLSWMPRRSSHAAHSKLSTSFSTPVN
ncbi:hypothetical protein CFP56_027453 [Quercus suber]|uniref:Maturase K n=1 Tax=Quercus suber TaxID=58331 RepID=A0AAW0JXD2_QUESU